MTTSAINKSKSRVAQLTSKQLVHAIHVNNAVADSRATLALMKLRYLRKEKQA